MKIIKSQKLACTAPLPLQILAAWAAATAIFLFIQFLLPSAIGSALIIIFKIDAISVIFSTAAMQFLLKSVVWAIYTAVTLFSLNSVFCFILYAILNALFTHTDFTTILKAVLKTSARLLPFQAIFVLFFVLVGFSSGNIDLITLSPFSTNLLTMFIYAFWLTTLMLFCFADSYTKSIKEAALYCVKLIKKHYIVFITFFLLVFAGCLGIALFTTGNNIKYAVSKAATSYWMSSFGFLWSIIVFTLFSYLILHRTPYED